MTSFAFALPEDRRVVRAGELAREVLSRSGVHHVVGAEGVGPVLVARALALSGAHVVYVTTDSDTARRAAADLAFVARYLRETRNCILPYAEQVNPDMFRELSHLIESRERLVPLNPNRAD